MAARESSVHVKALELRNVDLFGKGVSANVLTDHEMRSTWIAQWALRPVTSVLRRDRRIEATEAGKAT